MPDYRFNYASEFQFEYYKKMFLFYGNVCTVLARMQCSLITFYILYRLLKFIGFNIFISIVIKTKLGIVIFCFNLIKLKFVHFRRAVIKYLN